MISSFDKEYSFLSNFYPTLVDYEGLVYGSSEAAFQAAKTLDHELRAEFTVLNPSEAKRFGRTLDLRPDWEQVKTKVMTDIVRSKFNSNPEIAEKLIETNPEYLEEGNHWHDNIWGNCSCKRCKDIPGANKLGKILMQVRAELMKASGLL